MFLFLAACSSPAAAPTTVPPPPPTTEVPSTSTTATSTTTTPTTTTAAAATTTTTLPPPPTTVATAAPDFSPEARLARMTGDLAVLLVHGPREAGTDEERFAALFLQRELAKLGATVHTEDVPLPNGRLSRNVWATLGDGPVDVLLGAHYDTKQVSPGADDNASGVVTLLEMARRQAVEPHAGVRVTFVFFGAEEVLEGYAFEHHHFGSRLRAARLEAAGELPDYMVSVDQVGQDPNIVAALYEDGDAAAGEALARAGQAVAEGIDVEIIRRGDISDHEAFARRGVPAAFLWRPDNPGWHNERDTVVVPERLVENLALLEQALDEFAAP